MALTGRVSIVQDFVAESGTAIGDPLDVWFGGSGWMSMVATMVGARCRADAR